MTDEEKTIEKIVSRFEFSGGWIDHMELEEFKKVIHEAYQAAVQDIFAHTDKELGYVQPKPKKQEGVLIRGRHTIFRAQYYYLRKKYGLPDSKVEL